MMARVLRVALLSTLVAVQVSVGLASAQVFESVGTRALGMAGAFTAVADDASAVYWNPAGTATGAYVSVVLEHQIHDSGDGDDDPTTPAMRGSGTLTAFSVPVIGFAYYRLDHARLGPAFERVTLGVIEESRLAEALVTDHFALTLAQTIVEGLHVGVALKAVRGAGASGRFDGRGLVTDTDRQLEIIEDARSASSTSFDADAGVMLDLGGFRAGLTARNLTEPDFPAGTPEPEMELRRQVRTGVAFLPGSGRVVLAVDADLTTTEFVDGRWRSVAAGAEVWTPSRRFGVRGGLRAQTVDSARLAGSVGASALAWKGVNVDAQVSAGEDAGIAWGIGARVSF